jgi:hypothetical protein
MPFDAAAFRTDKPTFAGLPITVVMDAAAEPCPQWSAQNPDRALALLFVAPCDCAAVDVLVSL